MRRQIGQRWTPFFLRFPCLRETCQGVRADGNFQVADGQVEEHPCRQKVPGDGHEPHRGDVTPDRVHEVRIARPTNISTTPTNRMNAPPLIGSSRSTQGLRYIPQLVSRLKNLSRPARNGPRPSPSLSAHQAELGKGMA